MCISSLQHGAPERDAEITRDTGLDLMYIHFAFRRHVYFRSPFLKSRPLLSPSAAALETVLRRAAPSRPEAPEPTSGTSLTEGRSVAMADDDDDDDVAFLI